jgi:hypothetical protein
MDTTREQFRLSVPDDLCIGVFDDIDKAFRQQRSQSAPAA